MNIFRFILAAFLITGLTAVQLSAQDQPSALLTSPVESARALLPDTTLAASDTDSLQADNVLNPCLSDTLNMQIYNPDPTLTESMPVIEPGKVDEGIFVPKFVPCTPNKPGSGGFMKPPSSGGEDNK